MKIYSVLISFALSASATAAFQPTAFTNLQSSWVGLVSSSKLHATWSNGQAIREYQDFLASGKSALDTTEDGASIIITSDPSNPSPLANAIMKMGDGNDILISPTDPIPATLGDRESFPIYLCLPPPELGAAISANLFSLWDEKRDDLVYITPSKCNLEPTLKQFGLPRDATSQLLVGFSTPTNLNMFPMDLCVKFGEDASAQDKYAGESSSCGKWRDAIVARLGNAHIRCKSCFYREWKRDMWEKSAFDAAFNIVGACAGPDTTLAQVGEFYGDDASEIAWQMSSMLRGSNAIALSYGFEERMFQYAASSGKDVVCSVEPETWDFVNGVFLQTSIKGLEMGFGDPAPLHTEYVDFAVNSKNLLPGLDIVIPKTDKPQRESIMREGNLRADGNI